MVQKQKLYLCPKCVWTEYNYMFLHNKTGTIQVHAEQSLKNVHGGTDGLGK